VHVTQTRCPNFAASKFNAVAREFSAVHLPPISVAVAPDLTFAALQPDASGADKSAVALLFHWNSTANTTKGVLPGMRRIETDTAGHCEAEDRHLC